MKCNQCGGARFRDTPHEQKYVVEGIVFRVKMRADACRRCGRETVALTELGVADLTVARWLAEHAVISGESFRFMRKALLLRANGLAQLLGIASESISRWENAKRGVDRAAWMLLASIVLDRSDGVTTTLERLQALQKPMPARKDVRLDAHARSDE